MSAAYTIAAATGFLILILDSKTAMQGAIEGITLCIQTVVPALFPFIFFSALLSGNVNGSRIPFLRPLARRLGIPDGAEFMMIPSFLGGYPAGAQTVSQLYRSGVVNKQCAERLLGFSNNAGPSFIFGIAALAFPGSGYGWLLWVIHITGAVLSGVLLRPTDIPAVQPKSSEHISAIDKSIKTICAICAWVILIRILISFLERWFLYLFPDTWKICIYGLLELSIGCINLQTIPGIALRFLICSVFLSLGGICVTLQTISVTKGLSLKYYYLGKSIQALTSIILCAIFCFEKALLFPSIVIAILFAYTKRKNKCGNSRYLRV